MAKKVTVDENKPWQHGYSLEFLKGVESHFKDYNEQVRSPFGAFKKNHIAASLHDNEFRSVGLDGKVYSDPIETGAIAYFTVEQVKVKSDIVMFMDTVIGQKQKDDIVIKRFVTTDHPEGMVKFAQTLCKYEPNNVMWVYVLEEDEIQKSVMHLGGFERIGVKINTHSDIFGVYFRDAAPTRIETLMDSYSKRTHPIVSPYELVTLSKFPYRSKEGTKLKRYITDLVPRIEKGVQKLAGFTNHFSNYNPKNSWSALSLRGFTADPTFISKPGIMDGKNQVSADVDYFSQDTPLAKQFPEAMELIKFIAGDCDFERLRFMKLTPEGGELTRHTDHVDKMAGTNNGKLLRIHVPIVTNPHVDFSVWNIQGEKVSVNMAKGEVWYLDLRKPHTVYNGGPTDRIHLVADIFCGDDPTKDVRRFINLNKYEA